ncbi:MAG: ABC transporter permease, partial [Methanobrevibacter sp.]|nr:ABC transporter permease [Methanobrevibacter sp.]
RNKSRALLAIVGIGIGIATIVALGAITDGLVSSMDESLHAGGSDFSISGKEDSSSNRGSFFGTATFSEDWISKIKDIDGVAQATGIYLGMVSTSDSPFFTLIGINPEDTNFADLTITQGKVFTNNTNEVILGKLTAEKLNKTVGDNFVIQGEDFKVTGIYETGDSNQDKGAYTSIIKVQELLDDANNVSMIYVKVNSDINNEEGIEEVTNRIDKLYGDNLTTITSISDMETMDEVLGMVNTASWAISLLAIVIGGIGIINTMIMSVYERTREIGVLKAVGWKGKRILGMILGESLVLTITAGIAGSIVGVVGIELLVGLNILSGMTPVYTLETFAEAFGIAIIVGLIGGFYPAWRASRLPPTEALRYE